MITSKTKCQTLKTFGTFWNKPFNLIKIFSSSKTTLLEKINISKYIIFLQINLIDKYIEYSSFMDS